MPPRTLHTAPPLIRQVVTHSVCITHKRGPLSRRTLAGKTVQKSPPNKYVINPIVNMTQPTSNNVAGTRQPHWTKGSSLALQRLRRLLICPTPCCAPPRVSRLRSLRYPPNTLRRKRRHVDSCAPDVVGWGAALSRSSSTT